MAEKRVEYTIGVKNEGLENLTRIIDELDKAGVETSEFKRQAEQLRQQLAEMGRQQTLIDSFVKIKQETVAAGAAFDAAQTKAQQLGRELAATDVPTKKQTAEFGRAREAVNSTKDAYYATQLRLQAMRNTLAENNIETAGLAQKQALLRNGVREVDASVAGATTRLKELGSTGLKAGSEVEALSTAVQQKTQAIRSSLAVEQSEIELQRQHLVLVRDQQQAALKLATARNDEAAATRAQTQLRSNEASQIALTARAKRAESEAIQQATNARRAELAAVGPLTAAQTREIQTSENHAKALRVQAAAADQASQRAKELGASVQYAGAKTSAFSGALAPVAAAVVGAFAVTKVVDYAKSVQEVSDQYKNLEARLRLAVGAEGDLQAAVQGVGDVAKATHSSLDATSVLYARLAISAKELNITNDEALGITKAINQAIQVSGASAQSSEAAVRQLVQGLQSGVLRGDEFNSVMENSPRLAKALADGLGVPIGALRGLAEAGELTSAKVVRALKGQSEAIDKEFSTLPLTVGRALTNLETQWTLFVGGLTGGAAQSSIAAQGINVLAENLDTLASVAARAGAVLTAALAVQGVQALRAFALEMAATGKAANLLTLDLSKIPKVISITVAVTGFEIGYQLGEMLHENSELARKLGVGMVAYFEATVSSLQYLKEAAAAIFSSDTLDAAFARFEARNNAMRDNIAGLWKDAETAPSKVSAAADASAGSLGKLGSAGAAAGQSVGSGAAQGAASIGQVAKAAEDARTALAGLATAINTKPAATSGIADIVRDLTAAKLRGEDLDLLLRQKMPEAISKLSGPELVKFRADFIASMDAAKKALQDAIDTKKPRAEIDALRAKVDSFERVTRTGLALIAEQAAKNLGIDVPAAFGKMSDGFKDAQDNISILIRQLPELKVVGVDTGAVVGQALSKMLDGAKNQVEIDAVIARVKTLRQELGANVADGLLDQAAQKAGVLKKALEDATPGIQSLGEAMRNLGVISDESLKTTAKTAKEAYDAMVSSGTASARELSAGFQKAASAAIAANNGIAPSWVTAQAGARGYELAADAAGKTTVQAAQAGQQAMADLAGAYQGATTAANRYSAEAAKINEKHSDPKKYSIVGATREERLAGQKAVDASGSFYLREKSQAGKLTSADLKVAQAAFESADFNKRMFEENWTAFSASGATSIANQYGQMRAILEEVQAIAAKEQAAAERLFGAQKPPALGSATNVQAPPTQAMSPASGGTSYVSNITIPGVGSASPRFADANSQRDTENLLRQLAQAKGASI